MTYTLDAFVKDAKSALKDNEGPAGREKVRVLLEEILTDKAFVKDAKSSLKDNEGPPGREKVRVLLEKLLTNKSFVDDAVGPAAPIGTRKLYEDKDLGFGVLAHCNPKPH